MSFLRTNAELCKALGLDPNVTERIVLILDARSPARVLVRQYVADEGSEFVKVVRRFTMQEDD